MALFGRKKLGRLRKTRTEESFARQFFRGIVRLCILAVILVSIWYLTRLEMFSLREIVVEGGETIAHDEVRDKLVSELEGEYFLLVPKRFSYLYPHDRMIEVVTAIPRVKSATITRTSPHSLLVSFEEYLPYALWCNEGTRETPCLFVDERGYAFSAAPALKGGALVRHTIEGGAAEPFTEVIQGSTLVSIHTFIQRVEDELGLRVTSLTHKENGDIEFHINGGGQIFASGEKDFHETFENLSSVLAAPEYEHIAAGNFRYIDVRFDNKVFLNEEPTVAVATSSETASTLSEDLPE